MATTFFLAFKGVFKQSSTDFSAGLGGDGPSHFSPFLSSMSPVVDEVTVDPPSDDDDDLGVAPLPGSKGATANATSAVDSKTPPKSELLSYFNNQKCTFKVD